MFYFQHFLAQSGAVRAARVSILRTSGEAWVYEVAPVTAFGFHKGDTPGQTRWGFT